MGDTLHIETRARSRSKTPFLRSHCDQESCANAGEEGHQHVKKKKEPTVTTIIEEKTEILVPQPAASNKKQTTTKTQQITISTKTSDYSSDDPSPNSSITKSSSPIPINNKDVFLSQSKSTVTTTVNTSTLNSTENKKNVSVSESVSRGTINERSMNGSNNNFVASPLPSFSGKSKEISQNEINTAFEKTHLQTSTPIVLRSSKNVQRLSFEDTRNDDMSNHIAYREYREAGEYWKKYPKTDYTYSKLSPHRRVIAPGIVGMPNMSRKSLENHGERINFMIDRDPLQEEFIRKRYETSKQYRSVQKTSRDNYLTYDSQDEVDYAQLQGYNLSGRRYIKYSQADQSWIASIVTRIITTFYNFASVVVGNNENNFNSSTNINEQKGFFRRLGSAISSPIHSIYNKLISLLVMDTCILRSTSPKLQTKKRLFIFMLLLFPFLFLAAWGLLTGDNNDRETYLMQIQNLLPVSFLGLRNYFQFELSNPIKLNFDSISNNFKSSQYESVTNQIQKSMSNEEYENILNHVNSYVQELVDKKLEEHNANAIHGSAKITSEMSALIAKVVQNQIEDVMPVISQMAVAEPYVMSEVEIEEIIEKVKEKLSVMPAGSESRHFSMSQENLEQISKLIKQNIEINNHNLNIIEKIDIDEVLFRILQSPKLSDYVDARIDQKLLPLHNDISSDRAIINHQQLIIDKLNNEIKFIKSQLSGQLNENEDLHLSLTKLTTDQSILSDRFDQHETSVDQRFSNLLREINLKLSGINENQYTEINRQIKLSLMDIFQYKNENRNIDELDLQNWVRNMFVAKEFLEDRLKELQTQNEQLMHEEVDRSGAILIRDIGEKLKTEILGIIESRQKEHNVLVKADFKNTLDETEIQNIVKKVLSVYDADKTGMVDYALESAGGQILSTRCTENYHTKSAQISIFGIPLWYPSNTPRIAIAPNIQPGECWAFQGFPGYLVLKLNSLVYVTGFTLEHIPKTLAPNGRIDSAPRKFAVYGLQRENESEGVQFGEYEFLNNDISMQYFPVQNQSINSPYEVVELKIENNHGHTQYTCLYRFRVHGKPTNS